MHKYLIRATATGFKFDLRAANGETVATSEVYDTLAACRKGVESVRKTAPSAKLEDQTLEDFRILSNPKFELYPDRSGRFRFRLKARNGKVIAISEDYATKAGCEKGIESVRANADAAVETDTNATARSGDTDRII